jgi:hypothetical protein
MAGFALNPGLTIHRLRAANSAAAGYVLFDHLVGLLDRVPARASRANRKARIVSSHEAIGSIQKLRWNPFRRSLPHKLEGGLAGERSIVRRTHSLRRHE